MQTLTVPKQHYLNQPHYPENYNKLVGTRSPRLYKPKNMGFIEVEVRQEDGKVTTEMPDERIASMKSSPHVMRRRTIGELVQEKNLGLPLYVYSCDVTGNVTGPRLPLSTPLSECDHFVVVGQYKDHFFRVTK